MKSDFSPHQKVLEGSDLSGFELESETSNVIWDPTSIHSSPPKAFQGLVYDAWELHCGEVPSHTLFLSL